MHGFAQWDSARIAADVVRMAGKGVQAGAIFLTVRIKELISVPAPRVRVKSRTTSIPYYRATTPAVRNAPPRKLSGKTRMSITYVMPEKTRALVGTNAVQGRKLEEQGHRYLTLALERFGRELGRVIGGEMKGGK